LSRHNRLIRNVSAEAGARLLYLATRFFIPPFVLSHIGMEAYGFYGAVFVLVAYFGMSAIGFSSAYIKYLAEFSASGEYEKANRLLSSGFTLMIVVSIGCFSGFALSWPWVSFWLKVPIALASPAKILAFEIVGIFFLYLTLSVFRDALTSQQDIAAVQKIWIASFLVETALIFILVGNGYGLPGLGAAFVLRTLLDVIAHYLLAIRRIPWLRVGVVRPDRESIQLLMRFGGIVQLNCLLSIFLNSIERVIATPLLGLSASALLDIGKRLPSMGTSIPSAFASSVYPTAADLHARSSDRREGADQLASLYLSTTRIMNAVSGLLFGFLSFAAAPCLYFWLGKVPEGAAALTILFAISSQMHLLTGPGTSILKAIGKPRMEFHYSLANMAALMVLVPFSKVVVGSWDVVAIAAACAASTVLSACWFLFSAHKVLGIRTRVFATQAIAPGLLPYLLGAICLAPFMHQAVAGSRWNAMVVVTGAGLFFVILSALLSFLLLAKEEERRSVRLKLLALKLRVSALRSVAGFPVHAIEPD